MFLKEPWIAEIHTESVTADEADNVCNQSGGTLLTFEEDEYNYVVLPVIDTKEYKETM